MGAVVYSGPGSGPIGGRPEPAEPVVEKAPDAPAKPEPVFSKEVVEDAATELPMAASKPAGKKKRARYPKGDDEGRGGEFIADDPATPEDEAWEA